MKHESIHELFEQAVERYPTHPALSTHRGVTTYTELSRAANRLANFLLSRGAASPAVVAIFAHDPADIITTMLAALKAGCAFVPLDPLLPAPRLRSMLELASPRFVVVASRLVPALRELGAPHGAHIICLDEAEPADPAVVEAGGGLRMARGYAEFRDESPVRLASDPDGLAYIYFTSGSTGTPKAIAGRLKGIDHFIRWELTTLGLGEGVRVSQLLAPTFDGSLRDIFVPLCAGGVVCIPPSRETVMDVRELVRWLEQERVEVVHSVPSVLRAMVNEEMRAGQLPALRYLVLAGEALLPADVGKWVAVHGERVQLVNLYGTSETTMAKFCYMVRAEDANRRTIPIGKPIEGARAVVIDDKGRPCATEMVGEIYIRTPYRALGYYAQPELTREAFVANPLNADPADIVYRTGDLGRVLPDGNFEYVGRRDQQVKVRGMRVELTEIEDALRRDRRVRDVAVVEREDRQASKYLCAYVVLGGEGDESVEVGGGAGGRGGECEELRRMLGVQLPDYMVPGAIIEMEELPRTISGKVDRKRLPAPGSRSGGGVRAYCAPRTPVEAGVAGIWEEVLGVERVGVEESFFEMGGHSLLATQVMSRVREAYGVEVPLRSLFEHRTVEGLAAHIESALREGDSPTIPALIPILREGRLPLSFAQQRLWFIDQLEPGSSTYNLASSVRLTGKLDVEALQKTLNEIVGRHEALRTIFSAVEGEPTQVILPATPLKLHTIDLRHVEEGEREAEARRLASAEAQRPFDLAAGPLLRVTLIRLAEEEHAVLFTTHHIVSDGWSEGVLINEVATLYRAFLNDEPSPLPELPIQYADYAHWQREWLRGEVLERQLAYWREQLAGVPAVLELPTDRPRPAVQSYRGASMSFMLPEELARGLKELSRREGVTLFMTLLAGFQALLSRYTRQRDIVVGTSIAGRSQLKTESLIGFFVNTLVLRSDLSGDPTATEILHRTREVTLGAYAHQDVPFEKLVEELQPERDLARHPLFQTMFALQNAPQGELELPGLSLHPLGGGETRTSKFDLHLSMMDSGEVLLGTFEYSTDLFGAAMVRRMCGHFRTLLEGIAADPAAALSQLPLLTEEERRLLLYDWNQTSAPLPDRCFHEMFEEQAARTPEAVALSFGDHQLTYDALNERANRLAHHLLALGLPPESPVGVLLDRSPESVVSLLAAFKAGVSYLPLDPAYPSERLRFMVEDAGVALVLSRSTLSGGVGWGAAAVLNLDELEDGLSGGRRAENPRCAVRAEQLAYLIYTSGTSGEPKAVAVAHRGLANSLAASGHRFGFTSEDVTAVIAPLSFDISLFELLSLLRVGGRVVMLRREEVLEIGELVARMSELTVVHMVPSLLREVVGEVRRGGGWRGGRMRLVLTGGDVVPGELVEEARGVFEEAEVGVMYGPTEGTIIATCFLPAREGSTSDLTSEGAAREWSELPPIGRPFANMQIYVLDGKMEAVPVGVAGELYLGGASVARGYLGRAELTAEKFVPHPFSETPGARLYRTGDLVRYLADGQVEFLGRVDNQVKIRGFRIELGEVEALLSQNPSVRESVVVAREDAPGDKRLVAYVVPQIDPEPSGEQPPEWQEQHVSHWQLLYDETYGQTPTQSDPSFNITGWNSSYTGLPIPAGEMREWRDATVERILSLQPKRILEIGCGTGLLLLPLAPHCDEYWGTDFSKVSLDFVQQQLDGQEPYPSHVRLLERMADDFEGIKADSFDVVVLNSVVQYFPSLDYLLRVIEGAAIALRPGGVIFLGDVRNLGLMEALHTSIQLHHASPSLKVEELKRRVQSQTANEEELLIDPALFNALRGHIPQISQVEVRLKRGQHHNELTRFRYDVLLHVRTGDAPASDGGVLDWRQEGLSLPLLQQFLTETRPESLLVRGVPNARVSAETQAVELLEDHGVYQTVSELRMALRASEGIGIDPEDVWSMSRGLLYAADIRWSESDSVSCFDIVLRRQTEPATEAHDNAFPPLAHAKTAQKPLSTYVNNPLRGMYVNRLGPQLRNIIKERLPEYMVPSHFVILDRLPLSPNGKVDRRALPAPDQTRSDLGVSYLAPRTASEKILCDIWTNVLSIDRIGVHDNFFELGGHSLLATQVVSRVREAFGMGVSLRSMFESPTIAELAVTIEQQYGAAGAVPPQRIQAVERGDKDLEQLLVELEQMPEDEELSLIGDEAP